MAKLKPTAPSQSRRKSSEATLLSASTTTANSAFVASKRDKRVIKRSLFLNRISKSSSAPKRRRRPNKKLVTNLDSLAAALHEAEHASSGCDAAGGRGQAKHRSLKSKPGAMRRKEKLEKLERETFAKNMAHLACAVPREEIANINPTEASRAVRWELLRKSLAQQ